MAFINGREIPFVLVKGEKGDRGDGFVITNDTDEIDELYEEYGHCRLPLIWTGEETDYDYYDYITTQPQPMQITLVPYEIYRVDVNEISGQQVLYFSDYGNIKGDDGAAGAKGDDGVSPTVVITPTTGGYLVEITDATHPSGQTFTILNGENGRNGTDGADGQDGTTFTPAVSSAGVISWTNDGGKTDPENVNLVSAVINALPTWGGGNY